MNMATSYKQNIWLETSMFLTLLISAEGSNLPVATGKCDPK